MVGFFYGQFLRIKGTFGKFRNPHIINGGLTWSDYGDLSPVFSRVMIIF